MAKPTRAQIERDTRAGGELELARQDLCGLNLSGLDLRGANLRNADMAGADLREADLAGADLRGAKLEGGAFNETRYDILTQWPVGFDPSRAGGLVQKERL